MPPVCQVRFSKRTASVPVMSGVTALGGSMAPTDSSVRRWLPGLAAVRRASLQADLANAQERNTRLAARVRQLERRLSGQLGEQGWSESGIGSPPDIDQLRRRIAMLEQELAEKRGEIEERSDEQEAARAANRELTRALNQPHPEGHEFARPDSTVPEVLADEPSAQSVGHAERGGGLAARRKARRRNRNSTR